MSIDKDDTFMVNLDRVCMDTSVSQTCRIVAMHIKSQGGMCSPGDCLKLLPDAFVDAVARVDMAPTDERDKLMEDLLLVALLLNHAEGGEVTFENSMEMVGGMFSLVVMESLARKGLVKIQYRNVSLTDSTRDLVTITDLGQEYRDQLSPGAGDGQD